MFIKRYLRPVFDVELRRKNFAVPGEKKRGGGWGGVGVGVEAVPKTSQTEKLHVLPFSWCRLTLHVDYLEVSASDSCFCFFSWWFFSKITTSCFLSPQS